MESVGFLQYLVVIVIGCLGEVTTLDSRLRYFLDIGGKLVELLTPCSRLLHFVNMYMLQAEKYERRPLYFLLPINIMCQFSLILPSSAPGNAMAFEMASMTSLQMVSPPALLRQ